MRGSATKQDALETNRRLRLVMDDYIFYTAESQHGVAEAAILLAMASLALHPDRDEIKLCLWAWVDLMYTSTEEAQASFSENERHQIVNDAVVLINELLPNVGQIHQESAARLRQFGNDSPAYFCGNCLYVIWNNFLKHAPRLLLRDLTICCASLATTINVSEMGGASDQQVVDSITSVADVCVAITSAVERFLNEGTLIIRDGEITSRYDSE